VGSRTIEKQQQDSTYQSGDKRNYEIIKHIKPS
jgi:hypothetical protein